MTPPIPVCKYTRAEINAMWEAKGEKLAKKRRAERAEKQAESARRRKRQQAWQWLAERPPT